MKSFMIKTANRIINLCTRKEGIKMSKSLYVCFINELKNMLKVSKINKVSFLTSEVFLIKNE